VVVDQRDGWGVSGTLTEGCLRAHGPDKVAAPGPMAAGAAGFRAGALRPPRVLFCSS
jgi:hypothetical protein